MMILELVTFLSSFSSFSFLLQQFLPPNPPPKKQHQESSLDRCFCHAFDDSVEAKEKEAFLSYSLFVNCVQQIFISFVIIFLSFLLLLLTSLFFASFASFAAERANSPKNFFLKKKILQNFIRDTHATLF